MFKGATVLLLINTFYCSFGHPLNESYVFLRNSLQLLGNSCDNKFLSTQVLGKIDACNISLSVEREITEQGLRCLMFFDINTQLCAALKGQKENISNSYDLKMNQTQKVEFTCETESKNWKFLKLTEFPKYYNTSEKVFKSKLTCLKACGVEYLYSEDTNFFCKYYQWGSELLQVSATQQIGAAVTAESAAGSASIGNISSLPSIDPKLDDNIKEPEPQVESPNLPAQDDVENPENVQSKIQTQIKNNNISSNVVIPKDHVTTSKNNDIKKGLQANHIPSQSNIDKKQIDLDGNQQSDTANDDIDEEDDEPSDLPSHDAIDDDDPHLESDKTQKHNNDVAILSHPSPNGGTSHKEVYPNTLTNQFVEDDDHFFSFFLTAIILVIFLYVLYHNKSKCRKVVLGMLVEGRQPGRRRNSRGHEYRRLDTLEQAMSANSTAPPSKIIY